MLMRRWGVFRDDEDWARVRYADGREIDMPWKQYEALKLEPLFKDLPLKPLADPLLPGTFTDRGPKSMKPVTSTKPEATTAITSST
jgi:hypothetical protein